MLTLWRPKYTTTFEKLFDEIFEEKGVSTYKRVFSPQMNVRETAEKVIIEAELAGIDKKDVKVKYEDGILKISGEKKMERKEEKEQYYMREIEYGNFERSIPITDDYIKADTIQATFKDGVLTVEIDKAEQKKAREIEVKIS